MSQAWMASAGPCLAGLQGRRAECFIGETDGLVDSMGAPLGNQNAARARKWRDAIDRVLASWPEKPHTPLRSEQGLNEAAFLFVTKVMEGQDLGYFRELGDRVDGKPAQALVGEEEKPLRVVSEVILRAV